MARAVAVSLLRRRLLICGASNLHRMIGVHISDMVDPINGNIDPKML